MSCPTTLISAGSGSTAESITFAYGPDRNRWQQVYTGNGTSETTDYIGGLMDVVISGSAVDYRHYVYAGSEQVAVYSRKSSGANTMCYFLSNHESSVAKITNSSGGVVVSESFTPFGNRRNPSTWSGSASNSDLTTAAGTSRQGYTFQTQLGLWMGLNHMNGRAQDAITGRFMSADPHIPDPSDPQSYNRFSYAINNPLSRMDPTGFEDRPNRDGGGGGDGEGDAGDGSSTGGSGDGQADSGLEGGSGYVGISQVNIVGHRDLPPPDWNFGSPPGNGGPQGSNNSAAADSGSPGRAHEGIPCLPGVACLMPKGKPNNQKKPNPWLCTSTSTVAGAVSGAVGVGVFALASGDPAAATPQALAGGAIVGGPSHSWPLTAV
jgi:RHS repeat-associated protein